MFIEVDFTPGFGKQSLKGNRKTRRSFKVGKPSVETQNLLNQDFSFQGPNQAWANHFTYLRTYEGWLYLAAIMELHSRRIVGSEPVNEM